MGYKSPHVAQLATRTQRLKENDKKVADTQAAGRKWAKDASKRAKEIEKICKDLGNTIKTTTSGFGAYKAYVTEVFADFFDFHTNDIEALS